MTIATERTRLDIKERTAPAISGWPGLLISLALIVGSVIWAVDTMRALADDARPAEAAVLAVPGLLFLLGIVLLTGLSVIAPGETRVVVFFGKYLGTIRRTGLTMTVPLTGRTRVPVRILNFETETLKVNERSGSPVQVSAIVVWQVEDTAKAHFAVDNYHLFIESQAESALRQVVARHPYDHQTERMALAVEALADAPESPSQPDARPDVRPEAPDARTVTTLREDGDLVGEQLAQEVNARVHLAGLHVLEVRLSNLSYAPEIAAAMLQRQQAQAVLDARRLVVDGAVGIVSDAVERLEEVSSLDLDPERRASMTSNLLTVIVGGGGVQPVVNVGSLYS